jgi:predicted aspartyl protease
VSYSRDIGGGQVSIQRVRPLTVAIGALRLKNVPTDVISGGEAGAPTLLGLSALRPFRLVFDPVNRLIEIAPSSRR